MMVWIESDWKKILKWHIGTHYMLKYFPVIYLGAFWPLSTKIENILSYSRKNNWTRPFWWQKQVSFFFVSNCTYYVYNSINILLLTIVIQSRSQIIHQRALLFTISSVFYWQMKIEPKNRAVVVLWILMAYSHAHSYEKM